MKKNNRIRSPLFSAGRMLVACLLLSACDAPVAEVPANLARVSALEGGRKVVGIPVISAPAEIRKQYSTVFSSIESRPAAANAAASELRVQVDIVPAGEMPAAQASPEAFRLQFMAADSKVRLTASTGQGVVQGLHRLNSILDASGNKLPDGEVIDWPVHAVRALHITLRDVSVPMIKQVVDTAAPAGFNVLILQLGDAVDFDVPGVQPWKNALSPAQLLAAVEYARSSGLRVIPEVKLLSHQEKFLGETHPELMFNKITYDPRKEQVYELVFAYLDKLIALLQPDAIHIGHDELRGFTDDQKERYLDAGEKVLPAELFAKDVERIYKYLAARDIEVWMWGDMLISPAEFPRMKPRHLHGNAEYAAMRLKLPREIVICDWHYRDVEDFSSTRAFADEGFRVLGATWKTEESTRAYSRFVAELKPPAMGMVATTWWHLRRKEWDVIDKIIADSGDSYWYGR